MTRLLLILLLVGSPRDIANRIVKHSPSVKLPQANRDIVIAWKYPPLTNAYQWSLESTDDFKTWTTVTNYPFGYTNDVWATNSFDKNKWYRMRGRLP